MEWYEVYHSIGTGLEHNQDVENMRKILSFSYYNMSCHLMTCLLYLSMFPEDYPVEKDRLIWMWIAEGFIQCEKQGKSLFEIGESYFNELINRSMLQPMYRSDDMIWACRVHDMVLDSICSLSIEKNFVTISNGMDQISPSQKIRRLSIQNSKKDNSMTLATRSLRQVRSIVVQPSASSAIPALRSFQVLRVMDLHECDLSHGYCLNECLGSLFHLRYLGLCTTRIKELPEEIGNLQFLQTLNIQRNGISFLPSNVFQLKHLICLNIDISMRVPKGIGNLTSLEELLHLDIDDSNIDILEELGQITKLRVLDLFLDEWNDKMVECLRKLQKIQYLSVWVPHGQQNIGGLDAWVAPRYLRTLKLRKCCWFSTLPAWMNPSHLPWLSDLSIDVREIQQGDLDTLGKLQALHCLELTVDHEYLGVHGEFVVGAGSFASLVECYFSGLVRPIVFQQGAMPRVRRLDSKFSVRGAIDIHSSDGVGLDFGMGLLPSLKSIYVWWNDKGASKEEIEELKAALRHAKKIHPNDPILVLDGVLIN